MGTNDLIERLEKLFQHLEQLIIVFHKKHRMSLVFRIFSLNKFYGRIPLIYKYRHWIGDNITFRILSIKLYILIVQEYIFPAGQPHCKCTTFTNNTFHCYLSMMFFHNCSGQCQSDTGSAKQASFLFLIVSLKESCKYFIFILFRNTDTGIRYINFYITIRYLSRQNNIPFVGGILKGIGQKIEEYFLH